MTFQVIMYAKSVNSHRWTTRSSKNIDLPVFLFFLSCFVSDKPWASSDAWEYVKRMWKELESDLAPCKRTTCRNFNLLDKTQSNRSIGEQLYKTEHGITKEALSGSKTKTFSASFTETFSLCSQASSLYFPLRYNLHQW